MEKRGGGVSDAPVPSPHTQCNLILGLMVMHVKKVKSIPPPGLQKVLAEFACVCRISDKAVSCPPEEACSTSLFSALLFIHQNYSHSAKNKADRRTFLGAEESVEMDERIAASYRGVQMWSVCCSAGATEFVCE